MPVVKIEFDDKKVSFSDIEGLSISVQKIVSDETEIKEVMVYTNTAMIKVLVDPIEVFIEMSASKVKDADDLILRIKNRIAQWKKDTSFQYPINLTLIPVHWKLAIGI